MWPVFADPKTDFVFKRIFGTEPNKHLLIELLNALLDLAESLEVVPPELAQEPFRTALEQARTASFTSAEWDAYDRAKIAEQDARGAISLAERQGEARGFARGHEQGLAQGLADGHTQGLAEGHTQGLIDGLRRGIEEICELLTIPLDPSRRAEIGTMSLEQLEARLARLKRERRWD
jgi:flagellar biosynthesis/type III secretory pathway protein FliH